VGKLWKKMSDDEIKSRVFDALDRNVNYQDENVFGVPGSQLDEKVFYRDASFLKDAPFLSTLMENPNHIGCHTLGLSEPFFEGTQAIERELIEICATEILKGEPGTIDGYVASGGTEANLQAIWVYRNLFQVEYGATRPEICILCSEDSHYSLDKAANVLALDIARVSVDDATREATPEAIRATVDTAMADGKKYFIVVANMMTTMFGSVDSLDAYADILQSRDAPFRAHVDGAYGGFYYPFAGPGGALDFANPRVSSVTLDAHKMLQAPYGTGIFLARKGLIDYTLTPSAKYVEGQDYTLIGSRSGANAVAVWMILMKNGPTGWQDKVRSLQDRTRWLSDHLDDLDVDYYSHPGSNIVAVRAAAVPAELAREAWLVPDNHTEPAWYKIVVMDHVTMDKLEPFVAALSDA
jgi:glutamate/tyrosine decarboxylase-like PLP-dependent enzyme